MGGQLRPHQLERERAYGGDLETQPAPGLADERAQDLAPFATGWGHEQRPRPRLRALSLAGERGEEGVHLLAHGIVWRATIAIFI